MVPWKKCRERNLLTVALQVTAIACLATGCSKRNSAPPVVAATPAPAPALAVNAPPPADQLAAGANVYDETCATCHYDGAGSSVAPDLKGSTVVAAASPNEIIEAVLKGRQGKSVVNGQSFPGIMPPQVLSDEQVAAVVTYVRHQFANVNAPVAPADVAKLR